MDEAPPSQGDCVLESRLKQFYLQSVWGRVFQLARTARANSNSRYSRAGGTRLSVWKRAFQLAGTTPKREATSAIV